MSPSDNLPIGTILWLWFIRKKLINLMKNNIRGDSKYIQLFCNETDITGITQHFANHRLKASHNNILSIIYLLSIIIHINQYPHWIWSFKRPAHIIMYAYIRNEYRNCSKGGVGGGGKPHTAQKQICEAEIWGN